MQSTSQLLMVRPAAFGFNTQTADSNRFQKSLALSEENIQQLAVDEFDNFVATLTQNGIDVTVVADDPSPPRPDAIFPNNWVSTHADGRIFLYPMESLNRRIERRAEIIEALNEVFYIESIVNLSSHEKKEEYLEGTGSVVFDHEHRIAYACLSPRTNLSVLEKLCTHLDYQAHPFQAMVDGRSIYHTNVMMSVATQFVVICLDCMPVKDDRDRLEQLFKAQGKEIIPIDLEQMKAFAGNMLAVKTNKGADAIVVSKTAWDCLKGYQRISIESHAKPIIGNIPTIEQIGGGSVRCMLAEVFLAKK